MAKNIQPGRSLLISKQQSLLKTNNVEQRNPVQKQNYLITNESLSRSGIFKKSQLSGPSLLPPSEKPQPQNQEIRVLDSEVNVYKKNQETKKQELIQKLKAQFEKSNISIQPEKLTELVNQMIPQSVQSADNCIKVENNIFVISSCQMLANETEKCSEKPEVRVEPEKPTFALESSSTTTDLTTSEDNHSNLAEYFQNFSVPPDFIQNLNEKQLTCVTKAIRTVPGDGNFSFWINSDNDFNKMIFYNTINSRRVQFHITSPESLNLLDQNSVSENSNNPNQNQPMKRKVGRPRTNSVKRLFQEEVTNKVDESKKESEKFLLRTRCGRVTTSKFFNMDTEFQMQNQQMEQICCPELPRIQESPVKLEELPPPKRSRQISDQFRCPACNKIYLGKNKMNHHFKLFPDHKPVKPENDSVLYSHLMSQIHQKATNEEKTSFFLKELSNFVEKMEKLTPKLITNNVENSILENIDKNTASLLRINCGEYRLNLNVFDRNFNLDNPVVDLVTNAEEEKQENHENDMDESHEEENYEYHDKEFHEEVNHHENNPISNLTESPETAKVRTQNEIHNLEIPSLDCTEVNNIIRITQDLTNLTNISDIVDKIGENSNICLNKSSDLLLQPSDVSVFNENAICDNSNLVKQKLKKLPLLDLSTELFQ